MYYLDVTVQAIAVCCHFVFVCFFRADVPLFFFSCRVMMVAMENNFLLAVLVRVS